jgi:general secretion pathway protein E
MSDTLKLQPAAAPSFGFARRHGAVFTGWNEHGAALIAHRSDTPLSAFAELRRHLGAPLRLESVSAERFDLLLQQAYEHAGVKSQQAVAEFDQQSDLHALADALPEPTDLLESADDAPIIRLLNALLTEAIKENASDIHIEPFENHLKVRFRVDGVLKEVLAPQKAVAAPIASRIKVMAKLDIAERRLPQDGRISLKIAGRPIDVRVSTIPSGHGERIVLRLLDKQAGRLNLKELGMESDTLSRLEDLCLRPHGIFLVTGPTGSGKTTTLYASLLKLNDSTRNILTVEDPIEYYIDGIGQTQVNTKVDMSFARGLRAILRQDPDVVMVGEIRDFETAQIAVQASLTGHLVLSTLHTNSAASAVTRLKDMGIEPFLLSSSLIGVLAQRLVRVLDPALRERYLASAEERAWFKELSQVAQSAVDNQLSQVAQSAVDNPLFAATALSPETLYRPILSAQARRGGYRGRTGIYELIQVDESMRAAIHRSASEQDIEQLARARTPSILHDGLLKCLQGVTSLDEVLRVTRDE